MMEACMEGAFVTISAREYRNLVQQSTILHAATRLIEHELNGSVNCYMDAQILCTVMDITPILKKEGTNNE